MRRIAATAAKRRFGAVLDDAQQAPVVVRRPGRDIAVVLSMDDYERLRSGQVRAFLELRDEVAAEAARAGLTESRLVLTRWD